MARPNDKQNAAKDRKMDRRLAARDAAGRERIERQRDCKWLRHHGHGRPKAGSTK